MCGIAGFIHFERDNGRPEWAAIAHSMGEALNHRGPDDKGEWACPSGALVHRRLAVIDPDRGRQPMTRSREGRDYAIVYNGELYNTGALRRDLASKGYAFETSSDTEVLLAAYMEYGEEAVSYTHLLPYAMENSLEALARPLMAEATPATSRTSLVVV